ncbi:MAG TPA: LacI family DNA-binding transcriptional regulator [Blastocatellia bacterium]|nr:LacI family DNA-binding transcriptional regulator [Blastocatellia bacterium]
MCETPAMSRKKGDGLKDGEGENISKRPVSLKELAAHVGLSPSTLSLVLNESPAADSIPQVTKDRIFEAARGLNYRPHFLARSLRTQRTHTLGVLVPEISGGYTSEVMNGIEEHLLKEGYFYILACHRHKPELLDEYPRLFRDRCVEGIIAVDTKCSRRMPLPVASVSGHEDIEGVTNIVLNHPRAADLALEHLIGLGHRRIAFIKGQPFSSDTRVRWDSIREKARQSHIAVRPSLVTQLEGDSPSPEVGYLAAKRLLAASEPFTALFAFNDISAIGAIRAFQEAGRRVPEDISVIGFDDVDSAAFHNPALTTIRQPLWQMGRLAAETLLQRIADGPGSPYPELVTVEPELVVRQSTAPRKC